jgi:hypothetical protein
MIKRLVVNGDSYMRTYVLGNGHRDLAQKLLIKEYTDLSKNGCCNSRILRTTIRHSYEIEDSCFYLVGLTFVHRKELAVLDYRDQFEGRWITFMEGLNFKRGWCWPWSEQDSRDYVNLTTKQHEISLLDESQDLMYRCLAVAKDLQSRGHKILFFQQADAHFHDILIDPSLKLFENPDLFVDGLKWLAIPWQIQQGANTLPGDLDNNVPENMRHIVPGDHVYINDYLENYITQSDIL